MEGTKETRPSNHSRTDAPMNSQDRHRSEPHGVPVLRGGVDRNPKLGGISYLQLINPSLGIQDIIKARPHAQ